MKRNTILALVAAGTLAATPPGSGTSGQIPPSEPGPPPMTGTAPIGSPPSGTPTSAAMLARAKGAFAQLQSGSVDRSALDADMNAALTDDKIAAVKTAIGNLGAPASFVEVKNGTQGAYPYVIYLVTFANGTKLNFVFAVDGQGKIAGMQLTPPQ